MQEATAWECFIKRSSIEGLLTNSTYERLKNVCLQEMKALLYVLDMSKVNTTPGLFECTPERFNTGTFGYLYAIGVALQYSEFTKVSLQLTK